MSATKLADFSTKELALEIRRRENGFDIADLTDEDKKEIEEFQRELERVENTPITFSIVIVKNLFMRCVIRLDIYGDTEITPTIEECRLSPLEEDENIDTIELDFLDSMAELLLHDYGALTDLVDAKLEKTYDSINEKLSNQKEDLISRIANRHKCDCNVVERILFDQNSFRHIEIEV